MLSSFPLVRVSSARIKSTSLESDGSKGHVFEISYWVNYIYFDIRGSAGILLVLDGRETIVALVIKEAVLF
jgi:hypothetical protein